jgi:hypothetical protein
MCKTRSEFEHKGGVRRHPWFSIESSTYPTTVSSAHSWNIEYTLPPRHLLTLISSDNHQVGSRVESESSNFYVLDLNFPLPPGNTPRDGSEHKELDTILMAQPIHAILNDNIWNLIRVMGGHGPPLYRVKSFPTPEVRCEGLATIDDRCHNPRVMLQSDRKKVDFVLN